MTPPNVCARLIRLYRNIFTIHASLHMYVGCGHQADERYKLQRVFVRVKYSL
jgi:hypothetical protein